MKYGMTRWLAVIVTAAGLTMGGCSRSGDTQATGTPVDQFTGPDGTAGSPSAALTNLAGTATIGTITSPSYTVNPVTSQIVPTRATTTSVALSGVMNGLVTATSSADRVRVYVDRIPWGTTLSDNGSPADCNNADWLVVDTGATGSAAIDPDGGTDGVSACTTAGGGCAGLAAFNNRSGFLVAGAATTNLDAVKLTTTVPVPAGSNSTATICDAVVPVRITPSQGTNRSWTTLSEYPVRLLPNEFFVTFRFEYLRTTATNQLLATTYSACGAGCTDPTATLAVPVVSGQVRVGDFPFTFDALPPRIDVTAYSRAFGTVQLDFSAGGAANAAGVVDNEITVNGITFTILDTGTAVANPLTEFNYIDSDSGNDVEVSEETVNAQAWAALISRHPGLSGQVRAYAVGNEIRMFSIDRGAAGNAVTLATNDTGTGITTTPSAANFAGGQDGASSVASFVTGGVPRQLAYGPIGFLEEFSDMSTTAGQVLVKSATRNFTAMNAQSGDIITFLSQGNNGRTRPIADVSVDLNVQSTANGTATTVIANNAGLSTVGDYYVGGRLVATFGTAGNLTETQTVTAYDGATRTFTVSPGFSNATANGDAFRLTVAGAASAPNGVLVESAVLADTSSAVFMLAHADIQMARPQETGGAVIYDEARYARTNAALITGTVTEGRPAWIYFEAGAADLGTPNPDDLIFITSQTGTAANRVRVQIEDTGTLGVSILEYPDPVVAGYIGGPDNPLTPADDEGDIIVRITIDSGVTTKQEIIDAVANHVEARQLVRGSTLVPGAFTLVGPVTIPAVTGVVLPADGGIIPAIGTGVTQVVVRGVNATQANTPEISTVISRSSSAADQTTASTAAEDTDGAGLSVPNTAIRFYATNKGLAGNGITVNFNDAGSLDITDGVGTVDIDVPAGTTSEEIVEFVNNGVAGSRTLDDGAAGGRDDITLTNVTPGSDSVVGYSVETQFISTGSGPDVSVIIGNPVQITIDKGLSSISAAALVALINADPQAQLYVRASLTAGPTVNGAVTAVPAAPADTTTFTDTTLSAVNDFYVAGTVTFTSGPNAGITRQIVSYDGGTQTAVVSPAFPNAISVADAYDLVNVNDGQQEFAAVDGAMAPNTGGAGRSSQVKAMHDGASTGAGVWDLTAGGAYSVTTWGGANPNPLLGMTGKLISSDNRIIVGQYQNGQCLPSFLDQSYGGFSSLCFTVSLSVAEGTTEFDVQAKDGSGNITSDTGVSAVIDPATFTPLGSCSSGVFGAASRCEIIDATAAGLGIIRDFKNPILVADLEDPAYDTTRYEALASINCTAPPANSFCSQPVFVIPADAPSGGGAYTSFSPTVTVGGHVLDYNALASAFDPAAAGRTLVRVQSDNGYDSFNATTGTDDFGSPVPFTDGDGTSAFDRGYYQYSNIDLRTGAITNFTVTAWDQAGNTTTFQFAVRQFEGNVNTPPHFAIDCVVEDTPATVAGVTVDGNTPARSIMCENDAYSLNPNTPIVVRTLDTSNAATGNAGGRFGDYAGEQGPTVIQYAATGGSATTAVSAIAIADGFFVGDVLTVVTGNVANVGRSRTIVAWDDATDTFTVSPAFPAAINNGDTFTVASFGLHDATPVPVLLTIANPGSNTTLDSADPNLSTVDDAYVGGTVTVVNNAGGDLTVGETGVITDYDGTTGVFTVTGLSGTTSDNGDEFILRGGDARNHRAVGELATLGAGALPQLDFRTIRSDRMYLQGRMLSLDASVPTVYVGSDPTVVNTTSDIMPADGNTTGTFSDFLRLVQAGGNGGSVIALAAGVVADDNLRPGDYISLASLEPAKSPNVGLYRVESCQAIDANGYCVGAGPFSVTLDKPLPADAAGMFLQGAYIWSAPNVSVPVEGINSYLFVAVDSLLSDPADPLSGNQSVVPFAVIRDTQPPSIVIQGIVNNQDSIGFNPIVFMTDQTLFLGSSNTVPVNTASQIRVDRLDNNGEDDDAPAAPHVRGTWAIYADQLVDTSGNNAPAIGQAFLASQTALGQATAAQLNGTPARPLDIDNSCADKDGDPNNQCLAGYDIAYRIQTRASDRVGLSSVAQVQFNLVETPTDRVLGGALDVISRNPSVISLLSDPTELSTLTLDQLSNSGVLYNLNYHMSLLLGSPTDTPSSNPRQAFYLDSRSDMAIVLGTLLQDTDGTGDSESTVVILANVGRILLDNGVLDDLLPLLDDQAIINPRARDNFPAGPRPDPGDATLSSIFLEEILRDIDEAATPCNVGVNSYNCYSQPGTVKNTLPMVKAALDSHQSLRMRATDVAVLDNNALNARVSGIDATIDPTLVPDPTIGSSELWAQIDSPTGGFKPNPIGVDDISDSVINVQPDDFVEILTGTCAGAKARVKVVADVNLGVPFNVAPFNAVTDTRLFTEPFRGVRTAETTAAGIANGGTTLEDAATIGDDPNVYIGQTITFLEGANIGNSAVVTAFNNGTGEFTFGPCTPVACVDDANAGLDYSVNQVLSTACTGANVAFRITQPQGPSMEPIFDLVDFLLFLDLDGDGNGGQREVLQSLIFTAEEAMANPSAGLGGLGSYPAAVDRHSLVCPSTGICPATLAGIQDAASLQAVMDLLYELSDDQNLANGREFIPRALDLVGAVLSQYPREATNPLAPNGATVLEAISFILRDMLTDQTPGGLLAEPSNATVAYTSLADESGPADNYKNNRLNLMMRSTYIMGPNGVVLNAQDIALKNGGTVSVDNVLTALFPLLQAITDDPDDNPRGIGAPPFSFSVQQSVLEKLLPAIDLVLRDNRLEDLIDALSSVLDPGTSVSDLTAFDYVGPVRNTGFANQPANPYTVNPPLLKVVTELAGAKIDHDLDGTTDPKSVLDYSTDTLNVLLTRVGQISASENISNDGSAVNTKYCSEAFFAGRTPLELLLDVVAQMVETAPKDPRTSNFRDPSCQPFNAGGDNFNRSYGRILVDGLFDDPNTQDIGASEAGVNDKDYFDDYPGNPNAGNAYTNGSCDPGKVRGPNGGDGIAVAQSTLDILPEVLNTMLRFGYNEQDQLTSIFSNCTAGNCAVNNGYPDGVDSRWLSSGRLGIDLAMVLDQPFSIGSNGPGGSGLISFDQSLVREILEKISVMTATEAVNYLLLMAQKIAEDIQPINGTLSVPDPQDITRSTASVRALADPDGDGNPAPDGLLDDLVPVIQALGASGLAEQALKLMRAARACGVDDAPGANGRDIRGGELLKSSEDLTLILLDAWSGARANDGNNDGTSRDLAFTAPNGNNQICPADAPGVDPGARGFTGGPLDQNPPRERAVLAAFTNNTTTLRFDSTVVTTLDIQNNGAAYIGGLVTVIDGPAAGETRRITNAAYAAPDLTLTIDALSTDPDTGDDGNEIIDLSLSSVNVGAILGGNDLALTGDPTGDPWFEARNWGAATQALPPTTANFRSAGTGPGAFLCLQTRASDQPGGFDEACAPITTRPGVDAANATYCSVNTTARNCLRAEAFTDQVGTWGFAYDNLVPFAAANCNQITYTVDATSDDTQIVIVDATLAAAAALNANTWFNGKPLIFVTNGTAGVTAGDQVQITATGIVGPTVTFTVTGMTGGDDPDTATVRLFYGQECSYRVRMMREPYNGCFAGADIGGSGLGVDLSSFGGPTPLTPNAFRDSRMDFLIRAANALADGVNAVDTTGGVAVDQDFFDRVGNLLTVAVQPNPDPQAANNRSIASNLIFGPDGVNGTGTGPVQRLLNDAPTRSALTAAGSLFAELTAAVVAPVAGPPSEDVYDRYPNFDDAAGTGWPQPVGIVNCLNTVSGTCDGNAVNDAVDYQLLVLAGILETLGDRDGVDGTLGANTTVGASRQGFTDDPRILFNVASQFIQTDLIRQLIPGIQIIAEQTDLVPAVSSDAKSTIVTTNNGGGMIIEGLALANIISRTARSQNGDTNGIDYDGRIYDAASYVTPSQQRPIITGIEISPTYGLVRTIVELLDDWEQNIDYTGGVDPVPFDTGNAEYQNNMRYRNKLVALQDLMANLIGSQRQGLEHPFNTENHLSRALRLVTDIVRDTDVVTAGHDRTIDNILSVQVGLMQRDIIDTPVTIGVDYYRSGMDVVMDFLNTMLEDPTDCDTVTLGFQRGVVDAQTPEYNACVAGNPQAVFRDRGPLVERPLQPILDENLFSSLSTLLAGDAESKVVGALPFISALVGSQTYALDDDPVSGTGPLPPANQNNAPGCASGGSNRDFCGVEYTEGVTIADALFADIQALIPGSATVNPRIKREDDENRYDPLITDDLNRNGFVGDTGLAGIFDTTFGGGGPFFSVFDDPAAGGNPQEDEFDNIVFDCSPPPGSVAGSPLVVCTDVGGAPEAAGVPAGYPDRRIRIGFTATDSVVTVGNVSGINAALFDGLADLIAREDYTFLVNNQIPRSSTQLQSMDHLTVRALDVTGGRLPVDPGFVDLVTALGDILIKSNVGN